MRTRHGGRIELPPPRAQMLVGPDEIGRTGGGVEALRENSGLIQTIFADHGKREPFRRAGLGAVFAVAILHVNNLKIAAQIVEEMRRDAILPRQRRIRQRRAEFCGAGKRLSSGVDSGVS